MEKKRRGTLHFVRIGLVALAAMLFATSSAQAVDFEFHGQYRMVYYADIGHPDGGSGDNRYVTYRFRPLFKATGESWTGTLQLGTNYNNVADTSMGGTTEGSIRTRLAYMTYGFDNGITLIIGQLGLSDKMDNYLFDAAHAVKLTTAIAGKAGNLAYRAATFKGTEGSTNNTTSGTGTNDDLDAYVLDFDTKMGEAQVGMSIDGGMTGKEHASLPDSSAWWYHARYKGAFGNIKAKLFLVGTSYSLDLNASGDTNQDGESGSGIGFIGELGIPVGDKEAGLLAIYTSGSDKGEGFKSPAGLGLAGSNSYWGWTGRLGGKLGGGMDQGSGASHTFDVGNDGYGLMSIQARIKGQATEKIKGFLAVAWYSAISDRTGNNDKDIGIGFTAQGSRKLNGPFGVVFGLDYSTIGKAHEDNSGTDSFGVTTLWTRLQGAW